MTIIDSLAKTELVTARPDETVAHAAWSMARNGVGAVLVVEGDKLVGLLTERDVLTRVVAEGLDANVTKAGDVATTAVVTVDTGASVRECAEILRDENIRHLPVLRDGRPVAILSSRDFLAHVAAGLEKLVDRTRYQQALAEGEDPYDHLGGGYGEK